MTEIKFVKTKKELQEAIENQKGINQVTFSSQYYLEEINPNANEDELYSHHERFKKNLHSKDDRAPEKITLIESTKKIISTHNLTDMQLGQCL